MARTQTALTQKQVEKKLTSLSGWALNKKATQMTKTFTLPSAIQALAFIAKITVHAEVLNHHPNIELSVGKVKVTLTTHGLKGLSKDDFELAKRIDNLRLA